MAFQNIFDAPAYSTLQAAHYAGVPYKTLTRWAADPTLIALPLSGHMSFNNLAEAHILKAMRKKGLSLQGIKRALKELSRIRQTQHPLLDADFEVNGVDLCIHNDDEVINLSRKSQIEIREFVSLYLHRIERIDGKAARFYPFIVKDQTDEPHSISISPTVSFGRPVLTNTGISTAVIVGRFNARDTIEDLAREYEVTPAVLEDAIRWEMTKSKAA